MRKRIATALLCLSLAAQAQKIIQVKPTLVGSGTKACTLNSVANGHSLYIGAGTTGTFTGISDTCGSTWTQDKTFSGGSPSVTNRIYSATSACSGGNDTITLTGTSSADGNVCVETSGFSTTVDGTPVAANTSGTPATVSTTNITTTTTGDFLFCYVEGFSSSGKIGIGLPGITLGEFNGAANHAGFYEFTGTPTTYSLTFNNFTNSNVNYVCVAYKPSSFAITDTVLPSALQGDPYTYCPSAPGGTAALTWTVDSGSLPTGASLNSSTGCISGTITGTTQTFTVKADDGTNHPTQSLTLTVNASANTPTIVQSSSGSASSRTLTQTAGNVNIVTVNHNGQLWNIPFDTAGSTYKPCGGVGETKNVAGTFQFVGQIAATGSNTITGNGSILVTEVSGVQPFCDGAIFNAGQGASNATITSGNIVTTSSNSLAYVAGTPFTGTTTIAVSSPFTADGAVGASPQITGGYKIESTTGTYTASFTQSGNTDGDWTIGGIPLRPSYTGTPSSGTPRHRASLF